MYFDSHYYLQSSVGLEALYYKAAIELLQRNCELGAMEMMCRAIPDDKLQKVNMRKDEIIQEHIELFETASSSVCRKAKEFLTELEDDVYNAMLEAGRITGQVDKSEVITKLAKESAQYEDVVRLIEQRKEYYTRAMRNANWEQFCKYAEVYYAYLIKYAKERNTKDIVLNVSAYRDLISNDTVSFIAANWLPNQATGESYGTVSKIVPCSQIMSEVVDFINKKPEKTTEYDIARNTIKVLSIGSKLTERKYKEHVVRLLQVAADWESVDDTEKCAAYMLQVLNDFCAELPFSGDDCCIYRNILKEAREGLPYRYTGLRA